jgi:uncharacterized protein with GYD domain
MKSVLKLENPMQKYLVLIKTIPGKGGEFWEDFQKMSDKPMKGVEVESSWSLYGYWDFVVFFNADSNENSIHFVGEVMRKIRGIGDTSTSPMITLKAHTKM